MTSNNHVEAEVLAAWSEGRLPARESTAVETHLASCDDCQELLAVFARTAPPPVVSGSPGLSGVEGSRTNWHLRWAIPIAAAATVAAIWVAIPEDQRQTEPQLRDAFSVPDPAPSDARKPDTPPAPTETPAAAENKQVSPRRDASPPAALADRAEQEKSLDSVSPRETALAKERDQDLKAEAAAAPQAARAAPSTPAAPVPAQEQNRPGVEERARLLRQSALVEVVSPDPQVRWRIQSSGRLERSTNAGKTWDPVTLPQPLTVTDVRALSATTAIVTAADGRQFRTDDQGKTWNPVQP